MWMKVTFLYISILYIYLYIYMTILTMFTYKREIPTDAFSFYNFNSKHRRLQIA